MDYKIHISGLAQGSYRYEFPVGGDLFREYENQQIKDADMNIEVVVEKGSGWMNAKVKGKGTVTVECDRCLEDMNVPVEFAQNLAIRSAHFGEDAEESDEYIIVDPSETEVDLKQFIYDYICINLPLSRVHPDGECNPKMLERLSSLQAAQGSGQQDKDVYSPFSGLKEFLEKRDKD